MVIKSDNSDGKLDWMLRSFAAFVSLCFVYTGTPRSQAAKHLLNILIGSQMPLYFAAGGLSYVIADIGGGSTSSWLPVAYTLAAAIPIPFTGYLLFIRRYLRAP